MLNVCLSSSVLLPTTHHGELVGFCSRPSTEPTAQQQSGCVCRGCGSLGFLALPHRFLLGPSDRWG